MTDDRATPPPAAITAPAGNGHAHREGHAHGSGRGHSHTYDVEGNHRALLIVFGLTAGFMLVEFAVGLLTGSLAVLADAVHMLTDAGALALALFAAWVTRRPPTAHRSYGYYRAEVLAALLNALLLLASSGYILYEAYQRFGDPLTVAGVPMMVVAVVGLAVNLAGVAILHGRAGENLNVRGALYEVIKDALGSVGVLVAGLVILATGWTPIDPIVSALIALMILPRTWSLLSEAVNVLMESTPEHVDLDEVERHVRALPGVVDAHDVHVWTITSGFVAMSAHLVMVDGTGREGAQRVLELARAELEDEFGIAHTTFQVEYRDLHCNEEMP